VLVETKDFLRFTKREGAADAQLYISYVTPEDFAKKDKTRPIFSRLASLSPLITDKYDPNTHMVLAFHDSTGFLFSTLYPLLLSSESHQRALGSLTDDLKTMDAFGVDMMIGTWIIFNFKSTPPQPVT